jgi:hypothetical protein
LCAQREHASAQLGELGMRVAKAARLGRAAARAGDGVPAWRELLVGPAGAGVAEEDRARVDLVQPDGLSGGRLQCNRWNGCIEEVIGRAVVLGDGKVVGESVYVVGAGQGAEPTP